MEKKYGNGRNGTGLHQFASLIPAVRTALFLIVVALSVYMIIVARNFLFPLAFGALFAYLLYPVTNFLEKKKIPRILAILMSILLAIVVIASVFLVFYNQLSEMLENFEEIKSQVASNIENLEKSLTNFLGVSDKGFEIFFQERVDQFLNNASGRIVETFTATAGTIFRIIILPVFVFLMLFYRTKFAYFILKIVPETSKRITLNILREISTVASRYMGGVAIVVLILCVINSTGLAIIGVQYAILLGITSAFFNFIPYFGTLMGGLVPLTFVLTTTDQPLYFGIRVVILFLLVQFTENYLLTPNIVGGNVRINPLMIIVGLIAGAMVWGIPGMLVIIPFLAILKIIFSHIPRLKPYAFLLGLKGTRQYSIQLSKIKSALHFRGKEKQD